MSACLPVLPEGHLYFAAGSTGIIVAHDWTRWLAEGETIVSSLWTTPDTEVGVVAAGVVDNPADGFTTTQVSGGIAGQRAKLVERIVTSLGQEPRRVIWLHVISDWPPA